MDDIEDLGTFDLPEWMQRFDNVRAERDNYARLAGEYRALVTKLAGALDYCIGRGRFPPDSDHWAVAADGCECAQHVAMRAFVSIPEALRPK